MKLSDDLNVTSTITNISSKHTPVLLDDVLKGLNPQAGKSYVDGTLGMGGHSEALLQVLLEAGDSAPAWFGVDQDAHALTMARVRLAKRLEAFPNASGCHFIEANYSEMPQQIQTRGVSTISGGLLLDLGVSSFQLDTPERGFSFMRSGPLDMRMNPHASLTAADLLNTLDFEALVHIFEVYGEEKYAFPIAKAIVEDRKKTPWVDTLALAHLVERIYRLKQKSGKAKELKHPATRVFQALRMAVNGELEHLESLLTVLPTLMEGGSRVVVMTFHSLEDRLVKQYFKPWIEACRCPPRFPICTCGQVPVFKAIGRKAKEASEQEKEMNPRARSAKLRIYERLSVS
jgi:16S rRNA (cytosine1402-N4)-methyltransferase